MEDQNSKTDGKGTGKPRNANPNGMVSKKSKRRIVPPEILPKGHRKG
jgi:hypothetical protein